MNSRTKAWEIFIAAAGFSRHDGDNGAAGESGRRRRACRWNRVLLTRARQGIVLFMPPGDGSDATRAAKYYDPTFEYVAGLGIPVLD